MRHGRSGKKLGRTYSHRKAMLANLATSILEHKSITTTTTKAKEARGVVERLITFAKKGDLASRRQVLRVIRNKELVKELFEDIAPKYADRPGGYTRVIKIGNRLGDNASMAVFELVGFEGAKAEKLEKKRQKLEDKSKGKVKEAEEAKSEEK